MSRAFSGAALAVATLLVASDQAHAHATLAVGEAAPNSTYRGVVRIGHGCAGQPTTSVTVRIPEGMINAKPMPKPGWTISTTRGAYAKTYDYFGKPMPEGVQEITWSGATLPDDHYDEFVFVARVTDGFAPGSAVPIPIVQLCASGRHDWVGIPGPGQTARDLKEPAPAIRIVAAQAPSTTPVDGGGVRVGALTIASPWLRATPGGAKVAGGYLRISNGGSEPDRLVAASIPLAGRGEVHEMANRDGVMTMREVDGGLVIPAGGSVELKPGGFHLMFLDLKGPAKEGETVRGTLTFARAGTVEVTFSVAPAGARSPGAGGHAHH